MSDRERKAREECSRRGIDPDDICADGGIEAWMVVDQEMRIREEAAELGRTAALENLREAWTALAMVRETIETLGPIGAVKASEHLDGPTFMHEAEALVAGIRALAAAPQPAAPSKLASSERLGPLYDGTRSITRSLTPDGGGVTTPSRRAPLFFSYKDHRGEISMKTVSPVSVRFGLTDSYQEPQWLMLALDHDMNAGCEFVMADMSQPAAPLGGRDEIARRLEECALRLDDSAAYEDWHIEAIKQDHGLSETGRESLSSSMRLPDGRRSGREPHQSATCAPSLARRRGDEADARSKTRSQNSC